MVLKPRIPVSLYPCIPFFFFNTLTLPIAYYGTRSDDDKVFYIVFAQTDSELSRRPRLEIAKEIITVFKDPSRPDLNTYLFDKQIGFQLPFDEDKSDVNVLNKGKKRVIKLLFTRKRLKMRFRSTHFILFFLLDVPRKSVRRDLFYKKKRERFLFLFFFFSFSFSFSFLFLFFFFFFSFSFSFSFLFLFLFFFFSFYRKEKNESKNYVRRDLSYYEKTYKKHQMRSNINVLCGLNGLRNSF